MYVTLEPCSHTGKQPPCTDAVIAAGITRVVCGRRDPNPLAAGGAEKLRAAGIAVEFTDVSPRAIELSEPFVGRLTSKLPWVIAKWAATIDGRLATSTSDSKWISGARSRAKVQKLRSRVDAIVTGIGTVLVDDPELTCRDYPWRRSAACGAGGSTAEQTGPLRVVLDAGLKLANQRHARLLTTLDQAPLLVLTAPGQETTSLAKRLTDAGAAVAAVPLAGDGSRGLSIRAAMEYLRSKCGASTVLLEAGPTLLGSVLQGDEQGALADELHVFTGPLVIGHEDAMTLAGRRPVDRLGEASRWRVVDVRQLDDDVRVVYRRARNK
jgi:diaminohydroxyphosphoribosylaminopyrimidine deaminase/5-amino-6-(5-phosphoribosylamino)uracil reductase